MFETPVKIGSARESKCQNHPYLLQRSSRANRAAAFNVAGNRKVRQNLLFVALAASKTASYPTTAKSAIATIDSLDSL